MQQRLSPRGPLARHGSGCAPHTRLLASTPLRAAPVPPPQQQQQQLTQERVQLPQERVSTQQRGGDTDRRRPVATRPRTPQARSLLPLTTSSWDEHDHEHNEVVASLAAAAAPAAARPTQQQPQQEAPVARAQLPSPLAEAPMLRAEDAWQAFETQLEKDLVTTLTTLVAIFGVICFWRGVWSGLDLLLGDNPAGDLACILTGFSIILTIRLSGLRVGSFWPSG